jgi:hypothetical protein
MGHTDISWAKVRALPHQNLTPGLLNWQRQDTLVDLQRKLERVMVPGSLQFASAPQQLPVGRPVFSASLVGGCGFAVVDSVRESGTATPERYRRGSRSGLATSQEKTCSHSPSKGSVWVRRQPISAPSRTSACTFPRTRLSSFRLSTRGHLAHFAPSSGSEGRTPCSPSPCLRHYSEHLSSMGTPSP